MLLHKEDAQPPASWYEATASRAPAHAPLQGCVRCDACVVGGGLAGLATALELAERGLSVCLLEARRVAWAASGRNGGQVISGFGMEGDAEIARQLGPDAARAAAAISLEGIAWMHERIARHAIDCRWQAGFLHLAEGERKARELAQWMDTARAVQGLPLQWIGREALGAHLASPRYAAAVHDPQSGHLHPLRYCLGLAQAAAAAGVRLHEDTPAIHIDSGAAPSVRTPGGEVHCRVLVLAGNCHLGEFGGERVPELARRIVPVGTYMMATVPLGRERAEALMPGRPAASDTNAVLDYFRITEDHRLLFGTGETASARAPRDLGARLRAAMLRVFPQLGDVAATHLWGGFVDLTWNRAPHFGRLGPQAYFMQGFSGHGLALAGVGGRLVAEAVTGDARRFDLFARIRHRPIPGGRLLRVPAVALALLYLRLRDWI